jgi:predicted enzyme related to lactoylglutathione lyase
MGIELGMLSFQTRDAVTLASFWAEVLGRRVDDGATSDYATIGFADPGITWMFVHSDEPRVGGFHPDLGGDDDWREQVERVVGLGARRGEEHEVEGVQWINLTDPEGNPFDVFAPRPTG